MRSKGDCANATNVSNWATINITRPTMALLQNGSSSMTMRCGETGAKTFTVQNAPTSPSCITYTWKVANKGWSTTLGGAVQTTNIANSNSSITLYSADNNSAPPQSVEVQMDAPDGSSVTKLVTVTYNAPSASLTIPLNQPMNCLDQTVDATLYFLPLNSYSLVWNTTSGDLINGNTPPQTNVGNSVTVTRQNTGSTITQTTLTIQASCGNIVSNIMEKEDCADWTDYSTTSFTVPDGCNDMLRADVESQDEALEYDWYAYYLGSYHHLTNTYFPELDINFCACADEIQIYVRAKTIYNNATALMPVGYSFSMSCAPILTSDEEVTVFPNPTSNKLTIKVINGPSEKYTVKLVMWTGLTVQQLSSSSPTVVMDVSKLTEGKYFLVVQRGKKTISKQIEIRR